MEALQQELQTDGYDVDVVAVNSAGAASTQSSLSARCTFDLLQDTEEAGVWNLMGGWKDDFFIYRAGGTLAPGGYLPFGGPVNTNLATDEGRENVRAAIIAADEMGPGSSCSDTDGWQLPGDLNQDAGLDISDPIFMLVSLFLQPTTPLPCNGQSPGSDGVVEVFDVNGDGSADLSDPIHVLNFLFTGGPPPTAGVECIQVPECPTVCSAG